MTVIDNVVTIGAMTAVDEQDSITITVQVLDTNGDATSVSDRTFTASLVNPETAPPLSLAVDEVDLSYRSSKDE